jgi:DtxR family Mn-dependent transcriptional regulator
LLLFFPEHGLLKRWQRFSEVSERTLIEDALKHIHQAEMEGHAPTLESIAGALQCRVSRAAELLNKMSARNLVTFEEEAWRLTPAGREIALHIVRAHRLWERYLADRTGFPEIEWHEQAERYEHLLSASQLDALSTQLGNPSHDPHGDPIPTASGEVVSHGGKPLSTVAVDQSVRIVHLEDEPATIYAQLVAQGLSPGTKLRVLEKSPHRIRFWADGCEHLLAPLLANNISVMEIADVEAAPSTGMRLSDLELGQSAQVESILPACRGIERRRLLDLGLVPGTIVSTEMKSPSGDPTAYRIRGTLIGLRSEQANLISVVIGD